MTRRSLLGKWWTSFLKCQQTWGIRLSLQSKSGVLNVWPANNNLNNNKSKCALNVIFLQLFLNFVNHTTQKLVFLKYLCFLYWTMDLQGSDNDSCNPPHLSLWPLLYIYRGFECEDEPSQGLAVCQCSPPWPNGCWDWPLLPQQPWKRLSKTLHKSHIELRFLSI